MSAGKSCAFALLLALGCSSQSKPEPSSELSRVSSTLQALTANDEQKVAQCGHAVTACEQNAPDAAPHAAVCERLSQHCADLQQHLSEVREHVVGCLNGVLACQEHAPEQAQCSRDAAACEPLEAGAARDRATVVACSDKVEACLTRVASLPEAAAGSCENIAAACDVDDDADDDADEGGSGQMRGHDRADAGPGKADKPVRADDADEADETEVDVDGD